MTKVDESVGKWSVGRWVSGKWSVGRWSAVFIKPIKKTYTCVKASKLIWKNDLAKSLF